MFIIPYTMPLSVNYNIFIKVFCSFVNFLIIELLFCSTYTYIYVFTLLFIVKNLRKSQEVDFIGLIFSPSASCISLSWQPLN